MVKRSTGYASDDNLAARVDAWLKQIRESVAPRPGLVIEPHRCALIVVDMVRYFAHPGGRCFLPAAAAITPQIAALLAAWRTHGNTTVFTRHCHEGAHDLGMLGKFFSDHIACGEPDSQIIAEVVPERSEPVFRKTTYDAFLGTGLESHLRERGIEQVLITGVLTHLCCETTARAAFCRGFEVYIPADGVASSTEELHLGSLSGLADGVAVIMSTGEILERCTTPS